MYLSISSCIEICSWSTEKNRGNYDLITCKSSHWNYSRVRKNVNQKDYFSFPFFFFFKASHSPVVCSLPFRMTAIWEIQTKCFYNNLISSIICIPVRDSHPHNSLMLYMQDPQIEHIFMVDFAKMYFGFVNIPKYNRMQLSVCWRTRKSTLVQELFYWAVFNFSKRSEVSLWDYTRHP